ncbi:MAG TPA: winged helix-turn-helix transcriptional regulator [Candidatus Nanoarchaeia archaeon]|nr:winged helix-turn-helix transcriptional regulator [Candidatus Nanoarchaeia archaeon]
MLQGYAFLYSTMEILGKKWVVPLLLLLFFYEETNFSAIKKSLKITSRALSKKLKLLETLGLVEKIIQEGSRKSIYSLSLKGKQISELLVNFGASIKFD